MAQANLFGYAYKADTTQGTSHNELRYPSSSMRESEEKNCQPKPDIIIPAENSYDREASSSPQQEVVHNLLSASPPSSTDQLDIRHAYTLARHIQSQSHELSEMLFRFETSLSSVTSERDRLLKERDSLLKERKDWLRERKDFVIERADLLHQRSTAVERNKKLEANTRLLRSELHVYKQGQGSRVYPATAIATASTITAPWIKETKRYRYSASGRNADANLRTVKTKTSQNRKSKHRTSKANLRSLTYPVAQRAPARSALRN